MTMSLISTITVGSNNPTTVDFTNIPGIYSDLYIMVSARFNTGSSDLKMSLNGSSTGFVSKYIYGTGAGPAASASTTTNYIGKTCSTGDTANQFGATEIYISNYTSAYNKNINSKSIEETNATGGVQTIFATTWTSSSAITSISFYDYGGAAAFVQNSVISLYGINRTQAIGKPKAIGGVISYANNRWFHTFASSGTFSTKEAINVDALIVGGGGGGGAYDAGGGGAGGYQTLSTPLNTIGDYSVIVGAGGPGGIYYSPGRNGAPSNFLTTTSIGGGGGGSAMTYQGAGEAGNAGASGGGARGGRGGGNTGGSGTAGQGNNGGSSSSTSGYGAGGGGGAGGVGGVGLTNANGSGGAGLQWIDGNYYAGGGGGCVVTGYGIGTPGAGGIGGGGAGGTPPVAGTANTGGGGGGNRDSTPGATGGSGVVIISYPAN